MSINFMGTKNITSLQVYVPYGNRNIDIISLEVTDDAAGNDYTEFKNAIAKTGHPEDFLISNDRGFLSISVFRDAEPEDVLNSNNYTFYVNSSKLKVNDKNLAVFSYLANLTSKIQNKDDSDYVVSAKYLTSLDFLSKSQTGYFVKNMFKEEQNVDILNFFKSICDKDNVREVSYRINKSINDKMIDYIG